MKTNSDKQKQHSHEEVEKKYPPGMELVWTLRGHTSEIRRIAWSPDGQKLASPSSDNTVRIWDIDSGKMFLTLELHTELFLLLHGLQMGIH